MRKTIAVIVPVRLRECEIFFTEKMRFHGLDFIRFVAIVIVLLYHTEFLFAGFHQFNFLGHIPVYGSDIFFVVSGFLIGRNLLLNLDRNKGSFRLIDFTEFYIKRIIKILPTYYFILLINILLVQLSLIPGEINQNILAFFPLLQNFFKPYDNLMWESWSLAIEHWFYLFFPLLILIFSLLLRYRINIDFKYISTALLFIVIPTVIRYSTNDGASWSFQYWDLYIRKMVLLRFDSIGYGILTAYLFVRHTDKLIKLKYLLFLFGLILLISVLQFPTEKNNQLSSTFILSIIPIGISLLIPLLTSISFGFLNQSLQILSERTYAVYLLHIPLAHTLNSIYIPLNPVDIYLRAAVYWILLGLTTHLLYSWVEKPVMKNRSVIINRVFSLLERLGIIRNP